ncbi:MAG: AAA family ATPase [bacterium]|nr:AAA family ATPase [bacterium]
MIFKRKAYDKIVEWKNSKVRDSALLIEGARRIGKTTLVKEFAKNYYDDNYIYIDFKVATNELKEIFNDLKNIDNFFSLLFLLTGKSIKKGGLIIFDEVQFCPKARESIKYLVLDNRFDYIETGSLISIKENTKNIQIPSEERKIEMYPMDFEEFLWANDDYYTIDYIKDAYKAKTKIDEKIHKELMNKFRKYMAIGGMPKVLDVFMSTNSYYEADKIKKDIISLYKDDLRKHDNAYKTNCELLFDSIPYQLSKESTRFFVSNSFTDKRASQLEKSLFDLSDFKMVNIVYDFNNPDTFFELTKKSGLFKLYCVDTGLLVTELLKNNGDDINDSYKRIIMDDINYNFGSIFESLCCQMLVAKGIKPYYHTFKYNIEEKEKNYEIDFMYQKNFKTYAIEVKSTKRFENKSLLALKEKYKHLKIELFIVSPKTFNIETKYNVPIYMVPFI